MFLNGIKPKFIDQLEKSATKHIQRKVPITMIL